jgi:hypothetical protein
MKRYYLLENKVDLNNTNLFYIDLYEDEWLQEFYIDNLRAYSSMYTYDPITEEEALAMIMLWELSK